MGDFPMMTEWGTFIINGTERVVVTQLVRSPGAYVMEPKDAAKQMFIANLMPSRGSWLELEIDKKGNRQRPHRPQAQAAGDGAFTGDGLRSTSRSSNSSSWKRKPGRKRAGKRRNGSGVRARIQYIYRRPWRRTRPIARKRRSSSCSRSSVRVSRPAWTAHGRC